MRISRSFHQDVPVLHVDGEVDQATADTLQAAIEEALQADRSRVVLDLAESPFFDSAGMAVLLQAVGSVGEHGWIAVIGANKNLLRIFEIVGLPQLPAFRVLADIGEAVADD